MRITTARVRVALAAAAALCTAVIIGCTSDSAEGIVRNTGIIIEGVYAHPNAGSTLVGDTSGNAVTTLSVRQSGDELEGFDNNGIRFAGTIGQVIENTRASITLEGRSTSGQSATIAGNIDVDGTTATMSGTWIEATLVSTVYGVATVPTNAVPPASTNDPSGGVSLNQSLVSISSSGTASFTARGGTGFYTWTVSNGAIGSITAITGTGNSSATYTARGTGNNTVIVTDTEGDSATAIVQQSDSGDGGVSPVTLNQTLVTVDPFGGSAQFVASGGQGIFNWSIRDPSMGRITSISGSRNANATYTAGMLGGNTITATDATGSSASATIVQEVIDDGGIIFPPLP